MVKTKIICTIGPASDAPAMLRKLMLAGMDVARLNFSHGTQAEHEARIRLIRKVAAKIHKRVKILQDLAGYRIRIGHLKAKDGVELKRHALVRLIPKNIIGDAHHIPFDYRGALNVIKPGQLIYIDDGIIALRVRSRKKKEIIAEVVVGGLLKERKGINIPDLDFPFDGLTAKDEEDLKIGLRHKLEFIAQSFVRSAADMDRLRAIVKGRHPRCQLVAKIENRQGIQNIDGIINASDGIMVARGDMGVSLPIYEIPMIQKMIIHKCNGRKKYVITATQMLESMTENPRPTRAEVSDIANAILDGSDYVMLSGETAIGNYPVEAVKMMKAVIRFTERRGR